MCWPSADEPDLDNSLNMLSVLSFPTGSINTWGGKGFMGAAFRAVRATWKEQRDFVPMMPGGNCPAGVLGQVGGVLELAEQISTGASPDPERIYVPCGSGCTVSGLIVGTVLARHLGLPCLSRPNFVIVSCNVHEGLAMLDRVMGFHVHPAFRHVPLTISHTVRTACVALIELGGPDLTSDATEFMKTSLRLRSDADVVGVYGTHSEKTREVTRNYDAKGTVRDSAGRNEKELWLCGHFAAKAYQPLIADLEADTTGSVGDAPMYMLWMTKSAVQPRGNADEWARLLKANKTV